jgi:hypothetical protein
MMLAKYNHIELVSTQSKYVLELNKVKKHNKNVTEK